MAINLAAASLVLLGMAVVPRGDRVVVMVSPWREPSHMLDVIAEAGGKLVNGSRLPWIAVSEGASEGYAQRLFASGAVMVFDGSLIGACLGESSQ